MDVPVKSVKKALDLLTILALETPPGQGVGLFELAKRMGMLPNTTHSLLKTMVACGYVSQDADAKYLAGSRCRQIGRLTRLTPEHVNQYFVPLLQNTCDDIGESLVLVTLQQGARLILARVEPNQSIRVATAVLQGDAMFTTPTGRVLVAYADEDALRLIIEKEGWPGERWENIADASELEKQRIRICTLGGEILMPNTELAAMACPVLDGKQRLLGALGCCAPAFRCPPQRRRDLLEKLKKCAQSLAVNW